LSLKYIFSKIISLLLRYFHGEISTEKAQLILRANGVGSYLLRLESPSAFVISSLQQKDEKTVIVNTSLLYKPSEQTFHYDGQVYADIQSFVDQNKEKLNLLQPVPKTQDEDDEDDV
jgi:hypothetical protein